MGITINLRMVLLGLGILFVLAVLLDGLRRKYTRHQRFKDVIAEHDDEGSQNLTEPFQNTPEVSIKQPYVALDELEITETLVQAVDDIPVVAPRRAAVQIVYVQAQEHKDFAGYELLQALLASGLRFGEMNLFHRHETTQGTGCVQFSLASATAAGTFDIHNMGAYSCHGLCLFLQPGSDSKDNVRRLDLMLETAHQLASTLDGQLLDDSRQIFSIASYQKYRRCLEESSVNLEEEMA